MITPALGPSFRSSKFLPAAERTRWRCVFLALVAFSSPVSASPDLAPPTALYVEIGGPFFNIPSLLGIPVTTLTWNGHVAIDTGGNPTAQPSDFRSVFSTNLRNLDEFILGLGFEVGSREAFVLNRAEDMRRYAFEGGPPPLPIAPTVGSNLFAPGLRLLGTYDDSSAVWLPPPSLSFRPQSQSRPLAPSGTGDTGINAVGWQYGTGTGPRTALGLGTETSYSNVMQVGDSVPPRPSPTPSGVGTTFTSVGKMAIAPDYVAFTAFGQGFSGAYTKKLSDGVTRAVAEGIGNSFGTFSEVFFHGETDVIFGTNTGLYRGDAEGATSAVPIILNGQQFAPGRNYNLGTLTSVSGNLAAVAGFADTFLSTIFILDLATNTLQAIVQEGAPIPGSTTGETFRTVSRAGISEKMVVFEGFNQNFQFVGLFAWVNGVVLPVIRKDDVLDGKVVQTPFFEPAAVDRHVAGFAVAFTDGSRGAYIATIGPMEPVGAVSRKTHGPAGDFDIDLPLTGALGVECRSGGAGGNHTLIVGFSHSVVSGNASVTGGTGSVMGSPTVAGNTMKVELTGVADAQSVTVTLSDVTDSRAEVLPDLPVTMNVLLGDTNGSKTVNASDIGQTKAQSGVPLSAQNARQDVNASGAINATDIGLVKSRSGMSIPVPPPAPARTGR